MDKQVVNDLEEKCEFELITVPKSLVHKPLLGITTLGIVVTIAMTLLLVRVIDIFLGFILWSFLIVMVIYVALFVVFVVAVIDRINKKARECEVCEKR